MYKISRENKLEEATSSFRRLFKHLAVSGCVILLIMLSACTELDKPTSEPFFAEATPPKIQEFRWSNGKLPKSFDPATAAAPPETDVIRAIFEGLTETDPKTLEEVPGVAESWSASEDFKTWTFDLRKDAKWTNGKQVTASDFVRSWKRLIDMGRKSAFRSLVENIAGVPAVGPPRVSTTGNIDVLLNASPTPAMPLQQLSGASNSKSNSTQSGTNSNVNSNGQSQKQPTSKPEEPGIVAEGDHVLKVTLQTADRDFPKLVSNPIFRPIYGDGEDLDGKDLDPSIVTNGPFTIKSVDASGIVLDRSENYWNREAVKLERVHFVPAENAEKALASYRAGELDAVTNADFSPLVLKLLSPYEDFRRTTHSALNFFDVNVTKAPFSDRRVRQALSNAIEREKLTEGETDGATRPALGFLPFGTRSKLNLSQDKDKARDLLEEAGFPNGKDFPVIKLVVNRNDTQQRVARSVARMWKQNLNLDTEIIVKEAGDMESARKAGDFDLLRRGVVLPTADETANFMAIFGVPPKPESLNAKETEKNKAADGSMAEKGREPATEKEKAMSIGEQSSTASVETPILNEEDAMYELRAIPLFFPTSFSLVRPYVSGFEMNSLDALTLSNVAIDNDWKPKGINSGGAQ